MIISKTVKIKWNNSNKKYYIEKGYHFTQTNDAFIVSVEDLSKHSRLKVLVKCDYCGRIIEKTYKNYHLNRKNYNTDCCSNKECVLKKRKESYYHRYGVEHHMHIDDVKEKIKNTNLEKYGVENISQTDYFKKKYKQTMLERYGVENGFQSEEIKEKIKKSNLRNNGTEYPMQSKDVQDKMFKTKMKIGKINLTNIFPIINGICASRKQVELGNYLNGSINQYIHGKCVDIVLEDANTVIEYDGKGHTLGIKLGKVSKDDFYKKEKEAQHNIINNGWKFIRIKNEKDKDFDFNIIKEKIDIFSESDERYLLIDVS